MGMVLLYIFRNVGGYPFNPYGLVALIALYAIPLTWIIYCRPMFFAGALLAMNGLGVLGECSLGRRRSGADLSRRRAVITEWVYTTIPGQIRPNFDSPGLRAGKALTSLSIALAIASVFMILILRSPARKTLRVKLSQITFALGSYSILLTMMVEAFAPIELETAADRPSPNPEAVAAVREELIRREGQIQGELLALMPLMK